ncbi:hypothetical protein K8I28_00600 [bacterium]|nr:hypothetical protein [bacterium]
MLGRSKKQSIEAVHPDALLQVRKKFDDFLALLAHNNAALRLISDMEEKSQGDYLFDQTYIHESLRNLQQEVKDIIHLMIELGGEKYELLNRRYDIITTQINNTLPGEISIIKDNFVIPLSEISQERMNSVGSKAARLGELKKIGMPVPEGFAISAWAYKHFLDHNNLQERISELLEQVDIKKYSDLTAVSRKIQQMVNEASVPDDLASAIVQSHDELRNRISPKRIALRSSAIGEDTRHSFAGQYATYLNVRREDIVSTYRRILASKFTPKAIYYYLSHSLQESMLLMGVVCMEMVDAFSSGVVYTRNPVNPEDGSMLIHAIFGLGKYLVDGMVSPDVFTVSHETGAILKSQISKKTSKLSIKADGGIEQVFPDHAEKNRRTLEFDQIAKLTKYSQKLEAHFDHPQDIEWAIDQEGELMLLQSRPLRVMALETSDYSPDPAIMERIFEGGLVVCPGVGGGEVHFASSSRDLQDMPNNVVLVARHPFPGLVAVMEKVSAIITEVGSVASHMATIAREYRTPVLSEVPIAMSLKAGQLITVDATNCAIYVGMDEKFVQARQPEKELFDDLEVMQLLSAILKKISPLRLINPTDAHFIPQNCLTYHDLTRFCHQKSIEELFNSVSETEEQQNLGCTLKTDLPLTVDIIQLDQLQKRRKKCVIPDDSIPSIPMQAFWNGLKKQGFPKAPRSPVAPSKKFSSKAPRHFRNEYSIKSFAFMSSDYMLISLRMGYHFMTIESLCTDRPHDNYIKLKHKGGGAARERRIRRIGLLMDILSRMGFEHFSSGDHLDSMLSYIDAEETQKKLLLMGRLTVMTKQLDMALSSDRISEWYTKDFIKQLGLAHFHEEETEA